MSTTEEATINPDGSTTFETPPGGDPDAGAGGGPEAGGGEGFETPPGAEGEEIPIMEEIEKGIDPAFYLIGATIVIVILYYFFVLRRKSNDDDDDFFANSEDNKVWPVGRILYFIGLSASPVSW